MARGAAAKRPHSPGSDTEAELPPISMSPSPNVGLYPVAEPSFPQNPFLESLELDDASDDAEDLDNSYAAITPHVEVIFDPPARRQSVGAIPFNLGSASPITESETDSVVSVGDANAGWGAVRGPVQRDYGLFASPQDVEQVSLAAPLGPVTTVNDRGVLVLRQGAIADDTGGVPLAGGLPQLSKVRTRRDVPLTRGQSDAAHASTHSTPGVGAEYVSPTSMQFAPQATDKYRTPREVPEAVFSPVASELREAQEIVESPPSALSPEGQRLAAAWGAQALREGESRPAVPWSAISNSSLVSRPVPEDVGTVLCYIIREKDSLYRLYTQQGTGRPDRLLLIAREHKRAGRSEFAIATSLAGVKSRDREDGYVGTVQGNVMGTRFGLYSVQGENDDEGERQPEEKRLLAVTTFQGSAKKLSGDYRRMTVTVPNPVVVSPTDASAEAPVGSLALPEVWDPQDGSASASVLNTKVPYTRRVNGVTQHYLPYHGRCRLPSVKNFQLVFGEDQEHVVLLFGKDSKHTYCMDYSWPLCAHQAFGISLASIATKLCYAI